MRGCISWKNLYMPFCKLRILAHSAVLRFLVVKSFIAANDDQLRISFIILQISHIFFLKHWLNFFFFGHRGGMASVAPVRNMLLVTTQCNFYYIGQIFWIVMTKWFKIPSKHLLNILFKGLVECHTIWPNTRIPPNINRIAVHWTVW